MRTLSFSSFIYLLYESTNYTKLTNYDEVITTLMSGEDGTLCAFARMASNITVRIAQYSSTGLGCLKGCFSYAR